MLLMRQVTDTLTHITEQVQKYEATFQNAQVARHFFLSHIKSLVDKLYARSTETLHSVPQLEHVALLPGSSVDVFECEDFVLQKQCKYRNKSLDRVKVRTALMQKGLTRSEAEELIANCTVLPDRVITFNVIPNLPGRDHERQPLTPDRNPGDDGPAA